MSNQELIRTVLVGLFRHWLQIALGGVAVAAGLNDQMIGALAAVLASFVIQGWFAIPKLWAAWQERRALRDPLESPE